MSLFSGCGLPTWNQLIGATPQPPPQPVAVQPVQTVPTVTPVKPPPPPPKPAEVIAKFRELKPHQVDDAALGSLWSLSEGLDEVTDLNLQGSPVTNGGLKNVGKLTHLARLDIRNTKIDKEAAASIAEATSVEELRAVGSQLDDAALQALRPLSKLKVLELTGAKLSRDGYAELLFHPHLVELVLDNSSMDDASMDLVANLPELERLHVLRARITDDGLARLAKLDKLVLLDLGGCYLVTGKGFGPIAKAKGLKSLKSLNIGSTGLTLEGVKGVMQMKNLEVLNMGSLNALDDPSFFSMVKNLTNLVDVSIARCSLVTTQSMSALRGHQRLERLNLSECARIDDNVFYVLVTCKNLKYLNVNGTNCSAINVQKFKQMLPDCEVVGFPGT